MRLHIPFASCFFLSFLLLLPLPLFALIISSPASCGGTRVVIHAGAFFGPPASHTSLTYPVLAPLSSSSPRTADSLSFACEAPSAPLAACGRVVFVLRGRCDFADKVLRMQSAGAAGVVVVNAATHGERLANMKLNDSGPGVAPVRIPSAMISWRDWARLAACRGAALRVTFSAEGEATFDIDYGRDALNTAMMRGMALWILCQCAVNVFRYRRRVSEMRARADLVSRLPEEMFGAAKQGSTDGAAFVHDDGATSCVEDDCDVEGDGEGPICAVCLDGFADGERVRRLDCSHMYHTACIDPWLTQSSNCCPICKREVANLPPPPTLLHYAIRG